jgi:hypothetical protein
MTNRELKEFARLMDLAIESKDARIKKALANLTTLVSLVESDRSANSTGPLLSALNYSDTLSRRLTDLEIEMVSQEEIFSKYTSIYTETHKS